MRRFDLYTLLIAAAALMLAGSSLTTKAAYAYGASSSFLLLTRFSVTAVFWGLYLRWKGARIVPIRQTLLGAIAGGLITASIPIGYVLSIGFIPVSLAVLLLHTRLIWTVIIGHLVGTERLDAPKAIAAALAIAGIALTVGADFRPVNLLGVLFALLSALAFAALGSVGKGWTQQLGPYLLNTYGAVHGIWVTLALGLFIGVPAWPADPMALVYAGGAAFCNLLGFTALLVGIERTQASKVAVVSALEPVVTMILSVPLLGEVITWTKGLGGALVLGAAVGLSLYRESRRPAAAVR